MTRRNERIDPMTVTQRTAEQLRGITFLAASHPHLMSGESYDAHHAAARFIEAGLAARPAIHARVVGCPECDGSGFWDDGGDWGTKGCDSCFPFRNLLSHLPAAAPPPGMKEDAK